MTHEEVMEMMGKMGLPFAYDHFVEGESPEPAFAVFLYPNSSHFAADGKVYFKARRLNIEIYTISAMSTMRRSLRRRTGR